MLFSHSEYSRRLPVRSVYRPSPFDDQSFHWIEAGDADQTVVLLHGIAAHSMAFRCVLEEMARDYRVLAPDLPGHGRDETFRADTMAPTLEGLLEWLEAFFGTIDDDPIHLVGHSLGATISYLAALQPGRFSNLESLTLVSPGLKIGVPDWMSSILGRVPARLAKLGVTRAGVRLYEPIQWRRARMSDDEIRDYLNPIRQVGRIRYILGLGSDLVEQTGSLEEASNIDLETLLIWGEKDHLLPLPGAYELRDNLPAAELEIFNDCGHCPMEDCPTDFRETIDDFLPDVS